MSDTAATEQPTKAAKKGGKKMLIIIVVVVLAAVGGGGYYYMQRSQAAARAETEKGKKAPAKDDEEAAGEEAGDEEAAGEEEGAPKTKGKPASFKLPDDSAVKEVIELQPFIVNLTDQGEARYLRLAVSLGIGGEEGAESKPGPLFTTRVRNAMLAVLTTRSSEEVMSVEGRVQLRKDLLRAARAASEEPRVEAIYITEFIVQL
jgi:flagellar FliL protein